MHVILHIIIRMIVGYFIHIHVTHVVIHTLYMHAWGQVNHLCPFLVTLELLPIVLETASTSGDGRILFVSSSAHYKRYAGEVDFNSIDSEEMYTRTKAYGRTKLYNVRC